MEMYLGGYFKIRKKSMEHLNFCVEMCIQANFKMNENMEAENMYLKMVIFMMEIGKKIKKMDLEKS